jgi:hypothetical protein
MNVKVWWGILLQNVKLEDRKVDCRKALRELSEEIDSEDWEYMEVNENHLQ